MKCPKCHFDNPEDTNYCGKCATPLPSSKDFLISQTETLRTSIKELTTGSTFAVRYQVIEELGKGGMGNVYKVFDTDIKEKVALKLLKPEIASDKETIERFSNELKYARKISHRNVCRMYDLGKSEGTYFITMEYVAGEDLKTMIRMSTGLTIGTVLSIGKQVCDGLAEAHGLGVVHRDLKPQNIIIDKGGNAKIMDFGIARSIREKGITGPSVLIGTPEYMSPEQAEAKEVDHRSDIYSLGIILYEMVTGHVPFEGDTALSIAMKHKGEIPKNPKQFNPNIPEDLSNVILKCLKKDKERRYQTAAEVHSELEKIEKGIPTTEQVVLERKTPTSREITIKFTLKKILFPALIFTTLAIIGLIFWRLLIPKKIAAVSFGKPSIAVLPFTDLSPLKNQGYFSDGMIDEIISKLSRLEGWKVIPFTSVMRYKNPDKDIKLIGQELDVENILEGTVRKEKEEIRINVRLVRIRDLSSLWTDTYDRQLESIFEIQSDIAGKIATALRAKLSPEEENLLVKKSTENIAAYDHYLKGLDSYYRYSQEDNENAIVFFKKSLEFDSGYALAYAGLGNAYSQRALRFGFPKNWLDSAIDASSKAISIDPNLAEAYKALGLSYETKRWFQKARNSYERAIELNPNYHDALTNLGYVYYTTGELDKALIVIKKALRIPTRPALLPLTYVRLGNVYQYLNELDKAVEWYNKCIESEPGITFNTYRAHAGLVWTYLFKGEPDKARNQIQKVLSVAPDNLSGIKLAGQVEIWAGDYLKAKEYYQKALQISSLEDMSDEEYIKIIEFLAPHERVAQHEINITWPNDIIILGYILWKMGNKDKALKLFNKGEQDIEEAIQQGDELPSLRRDMAVIRSFQGRKSEAIKWLEQAIEIGWRSYTLSLKDPLLENLHNDSQFQTLMAKVKTMVDEMHKKVQREL